MIKVGDKVKTWIDIKIGEVVGYNEITKEVIVKTKGRHGLDTLPLRCVEKV